MLLHLVLLWSGLIVSCGTSHDTTQSDVEGWGTEIAQGIADIKPRPVAVLREFAKVLTLRSASTTKSLGVTSGPAMREAFAAHYLRAVKQVGGLPRSQGEEVLKNLVDPDSTQCGGASCAAIFGIKTDVVNPFMDALMLKVATSASLARQETMPLRRALLSSLKPDKALKSRDSFAVFLGKTADQLPMELPQKVREPDGILSKLELEKRAGVEFVQLLKDYTGSDFDKYRMVEAFDDEAKTMQGWNDQELQVWRRKALILNQGLKTLPQVNQPVYRGIKEVSREQLHKWMIMREKGEPLSLGILDKSGVASASWDPQIGRKFAGIGHLFGEKQTFSVVFEITNHKGVGVQHVSLVPWEKEVLIPSHVRFKIESVAPLSNSNGMIHIRLRGLDSASRARISYDRLQMVA